MTRACSRSTPSVARHWKALADRAARRAVALRFGAFAHFVADRGGLARALQDVVAVHPLEVHDAAQREQRLAGARADGEAPAALARGFAAAHDDRRGGLAGPQFDPLVDGV